MLNLRMEFSFSEKLKPDYTVPIICLVVTRVCLAILIPYVIVKKKEKTIIKKAIKNQKF